MHASRAKQIPAAKAKAGGTAKSLSFPPPKEQMDLVGKWDLRCEFLFCDKLFYFHCVILIFKPINNIWFFRVYLEGFVLQLLFFLCPVSFVMDSNAVVRPVRLFDSFPICEWM